MDIVTPWDIGCLELVGPASIFLVALRPDRKTGSRPGAPSTTKENESRRMREWIGYSRTNHRVNLIVLLVWLDRV